MSKSGKQYEYKSTDEEKILKYTVKHRRVSVQYLEYLKGQFAKTKVK